MKERVGLKGKAPELVPTIRENKVFKPFETKPIDPEAFENSGDGDSISYNFRLKGLNGKVVVCLNSVINMGGDMGSIIRISFTITNTEQVKTLARYQAIIRWGFDPTTTGVPRDHAILECHGGRFDPHPDAFWQIGNGPRLTWEEYTKKNIEERGHDVVSAEVHRSPESLSSIQSMQIEFQQKPQPRKK